MGRTESVEGTNWPRHLHPGALRWTRASSRYEDTVAFYRDLVGLPVLGEFRSSFGEDGTIFGLPDTTVQLEIVRARGDDWSGSLDQLVLYLDGALAMDVAIAPLAAAGVRPDSTPHPYWAANGAVTFSDPDGRGVVFTPWVYGDVPDPVDRPSGEERVDVTGPALDVDWYHGDRELLRALFEEAEDSSECLDTYIDEGRVIVARLAQQVVGHLQLIDAEQDNAVELKNMAVAPGKRGLGIGRRLVDQALDVSRQDGYVCMLVGTGAADTGNLRFYQRCGFRMSSVEWDAFDSDGGYAADLTIEGIPLRDRVWLTQRL